MLRSKALLEMQKGKKVKHRYFTDYSYMHIVDGKIVHQNGRPGEQVFYEAGNGNGWVIYKEPRAKRPKHIIVVNEIKNQKDAVAFMLGGCADFKLHSKTTGNTFRYRLWKKPIEKGYLFYLSSNKTYLGCLIGDSKDKLVFRRTKGYPDSMGSRIIEDMDRIMKSFEWTFAHLVKETLPDNIQVLHLGTCSACGRVLSDPESIQKGIGPFCLKKLSLENS